jgi:non-heme chloroperoxidase
MIQSREVRLSSDLTLHVEQSGHGQLHLVFVPGWTMSTAVFEHQLRHFEHSQSVTVTTYDPRGQGLSSKTAEGHTYAQHGRDLDALLDQLDITEAVLLGWSNGGGDVLEYVRQFGASRLSGLAMIDACPAACAADPMRDWAWFPRGISSPSRAA